MKQIFTCGMGGLNRTQYTYYIRMRYVCVCVCVCVCDCV